VILGIAKILAGLTLLLPRLPRYLPPLSLGAIAMVSRATRPPARRL
jgi:hypothetical protein